MYKETIVKKEIEFKNYQKFCDICSKEITIGLECSKAKCMYCKKDLCEDCVGHENDTHGDYRDIWCKKCWEIGEEYRPIIEELHKKIEVLNKEWQDKCKLQ